jgi:hypothetical protein
MKLTPKEQAANMWRIHNFYWVDEDLIAKQRICLQIAQIQRELKKYGVSDNDYWNEVKRLIYEMND